MPTGSILVEDVDGFTLADSPATESGSFLLTDGLHKWGRVKDISIILFGLSHTFPDDLDFLFVGPDGRNLEFWSDAGAGSDIVNTTFTISDSGASLLPDEPAGAIAAGTYKPSDYSTTEDASNWGLAPSLIINHPSHNGAATFASAFTGAWFDNATWAFYVRDDASNDVGSLSGWGAQFTYNIIVKTDDFNADERSDVLWRNDSGQVYFWNMNGTQISGEGAAVHAAVSADWHIEGTGDFDADGKSDIFWRNDNGQTYVWEMNGLGIKAEGSVAHAPVPTGWHIERIGDFDGDTNSDIFWRHDSGQTYIWEMNGFGVKTEGTVVHAPVPSDWHVQGIGDFNNDGNSDIFWRNDNGAVYIWEMNGLGIKAEGSVAHAPVPSDWHVEDIGDFNNDGKSDILWRHDSGQTYVWEMNGLGVLAEGAVAHAPVPNDWHVFSQHNFV